MPLTGIRIGRAPVGKNYWAGRKKIGKNTWSGEIDLKGKGRYVWALKKSAYFEHKTIAEGTAATLESAKAAINQAVQKYL